MTESSMFDQHCSETAEISINITISNTCVPPQILDNLNQPLRTVGKTKSRLLSCISANADVGFLLAFSCWLYYAQLAGPMYCYY